ncbi:glutamine synthetase type III [Caproiciproducens galactitolivorans]|uniref:Glutamine synthetase n=1 Tax=Caproiciproducens galactitolivorans TaxID=642589 RepID=A0A4Z0YLE0_9FIRM|nr:glutamine synthetase III [Caproiciproducens galactitolivorans]QEY35777.1 glutamine synthetase type III [Caproiciproducens galactitolivorans]TGJ77512.1 glutamine synthetase [Caproiciproducens galactitolivorans]
MGKVPEMFGSMVFNDSVMKEKLPKETYKALKKTREEGKPLDPSVANVVANAMKEWAIEKGATHFTHWFQPMTGITAEKHDSFIYPVENDRVIMEFSGKELIKGEPDASSFPSGGLRATFEARGYTAWDPTSNAFIKDGTLCIPTAFCSYGGEALDKKTPLLRSMNAINKQAMRILRLFGNTDANRVITTVGSEQEYFLIDKAMYEKRKDLIYTGRTLFGAKPPKGQELEDHYFGVIKPRVSAYMKELDEELWKLGILAKTKHNEVAPSQHELAPIFTTANVATDQNQLTMEIMKKVATKHNLTCLLHEKPFAGVNGSGKHNNWSISTDTGVNLLEPGDSPRENAQFLLFLAAIIKAVDEHQDLLRISVASAGNDHRLGANEAPPAIVSIFIGDELMGVLKSIEDGTAYKQKDKAFMKIGVDVLPTFPKDSTDRNRTSPFAFTGNKFEFRMLGSTVSIACPNIMLNTIIADALCDFADELEKAEDFNSTLTELIRKTVKEHKRIIFNGNNYSDEWVEEAKRRGLLNLRSTADALPYYISDANVKLFEKQGVFSKTEIHSRYEIQLENYCKQIHIEALTMVDMVKKDILPAACSYMKDISKEAINKKQLCADICCELEETLLKKLSTLSAELYKKTVVLKSSVEPEKEFKDVLEQAQYYRNTVFARMEDARAIADEIESLVGRKYWPYPTYGDLLFSVI